MISRKPIASYHNTHEPLLRTFITTRTSAKKFAEDVPRELGCISQVHYTTFCAVGLEKKSPGNKIESLRTTLKNYWLLGAMFGGMHAVSLSAGNWSLTDLGTLGGSETFADSINDLGQVVGMSRVTGDSGTHAFFYDNGVMQDLAPINSGDIRASFRLGLNNSGRIVSGVVTDDAYYPAIYDRQSGQTTTLGSLGSTSGFTGVATAINNSGMAVGISYLSSGVRHGFVYRNGTMSDLGSLGGYSGALAINSAGTAAGFSSDSPNGFQRAVIWANNSILDISNGFESEARGINDFGKVVGETMTLAGNQEAFLWSDGSSENLGSLAPSRSSEAFGINNQGDIVGTAEAVCGFTYRTNPITGVVTIVTNYQNHAFIYSNGSMIDLNNMISTNSGWELYYAFAINNSDQIVGWGSMDGGEHIHSFILQIPEPSVPTLFILIASAFALRSRCLRIKRLLEPITLKQPRQFDAILEIEFLNKKGVGS
jgi:probable HAF family extracellular repeat protein